MSLQVRAQENSVSHPTLSHSLPSEVQESVLSSSDRARFTAWGLDNEEWLRYQTLMQGIRGSISPSTLSPIEVLGIHARTAQERRRYAEQWAILMREDAERILAFQHAYDEAQRNLFSGTELIDPATIEALRFRERRSRAPALTLGDRILFFASRDCAVCDTVFESLLKQLPAGAGIDVYLVGVTNGEEPAIREWAAERGIDRQKVQNRQITLNFEGGLLQKLNRSADKLPLILRRRGSNLEALPASAF